MASSGFEAVALKKLRDLLQEKGYTPEMIFSKYDYNGDGGLSFEEFESALVKITGQSAPKPILNAVFSTLDSDGNGYLQLEELYSLIEGGPSQDIPEGEINKIVVSGHTDDSYNDEYHLQYGEINGKPWYRSINGMILYHYIPNGDGGATSWSLDDREQDGSNDWYRGGWTRGGEDLPLGTRRWVGVGMVTLTPAISQGTSQPNYNEIDTSNIRIEIEKSTYKNGEDLTVSYTGPQLDDDAWIGIVSAEVPHGDEEVNDQHDVSFQYLAGKTIAEFTFSSPGPGDWTMRLHDSDNQGKELAYVEFNVLELEEEPVSSTMTHRNMILDTEPEMEFELGEEEFSVEKMISSLGPEFTSDLENILSNPNQNLEEARIAADEIADSKIEQLPFFYRAPARKIWESNADSLLARIADNLPPTEDLAKAAAVASAVGLGAATVAAQAGLEAQTPEEAIVGAVVNTMLDHTTDAVFESISPAEDNTVPEAEVEVEVVPEPVPEMMEDSDLSVLDLPQVYSDLENARFLNDQAQITESAKGKTVQASVRVVKIERTLSIGIDDEYRGGQTIIGNIDGVGDVEIHLKNSVDMTEIRTNQISELIISIHKWNGIRKRLELYAH
tara:strand:- start:6212 stop:8050 length:1839 start_codon:yes stop_codon:yes gene_type:complete